MTKKHKGFGDFFLGDKDGNIFSDYCESFFQKKNLPSHPSPLGYSNIIERYGFANVSEGEDNAYPFHILSKNELQLCFSISNLISSNFFIILMLDFFKNVLSCSESFFLK